VDLEAISHQEEEAFELYKQRFIQQHPMPFLRRATGLDWKFYAILVTSIGALALATLRTMDIFYEAALLSGNPYLAIAEAVAVVLAIEGGILVWSAVRASSRGDVGMGKLGFGIALAVLISMFAGLGQSLHLIENINTELLRYFQYSLTLIIGVGASLVAWIGGEVLGGQIAQAGQRQEDAGLSYREQKQVYYDRLLASWQRSAERKMVRGDLTAEASVRSVPNDRTNDHRTNLKNYGSSEQRERILQYIDQTVLDDGYIPGPSEVAQNVGTAKSYAHQVIGEWKSDNGRAQ
jgi:hypothetical protein